MRRKLLIGLLAAGTVGGFASGFSRVAWRMHQHRYHADSYETGHWKRGCRTGDRRAQAAPPAPETTTRPPVP